MSLLLLNSAKRELTTYRSNIRDDQEPVQVQVGREASPRLRQATVPSLGTIPDGDMQIVARMTEY